MEDNNKKKNNSEIWNDTNNNNNNNNNNKIIDNKKSKDESMDEEIYKENILDNYRSPHNYKELSIHNIHHKESNASCGDEFEVYLNIKNGVIEDVSFTGAGCAISTASMSILTDKVKGMKIDDIKKISKEEILKMLGINIGFGRMNCALISIRGITNAINNQTKLKKK